MSSDQPRDTRGGIEGQLQFLPVNHVNSPAEARRQRVYLSCDSCRQRKIRCIPDVPGQSCPCRRCVTDDRSCRFRSTRAVGVKRDGHDRISKGGPKKSSPLAHHQASAGTIHVAIDDSPSQEYGTNEEGTDTTTLHGQFPQPSEYYPSSHESPPNYVGQDGEFQSAGDVGFWQHAASTSLDTTKTAASPTATARRQIITMRMHNTADALDLLTVAAVGAQSEVEQDSTPAPSTSRHAAHTATSHQPVNACSAASWPRPAKESDWKSFILIKKGFLTKGEVIEYLDFYFGILWPLRPMVHPFYRDRARYSLLAAEEPLLLICLVVLASRYQALSGSLGEIRSERIHWQVWQLLQKYLQSALWGSPITRSAGAIVAMLLMIEWHSKSINNPLGLSNDDYELLGVPEPGQRCDREDLDTLSSSANRQYGMSTLLERLNIVAPAYRSNKMSWMLLANAIALAQERGCFEQDAREFQGDLSAYDSFKHEWNQLICVFIYLADESLSMRLGLDTLLPSKLVNTVRDRFSLSFASVLTDSVLWESYYELTCEVKKARELLQSLKKAGPEAAASGILSDLEHVERGLHRWKNQCSYTVANEPSLLRACLDLEYQYSIMYSFAPASHMGLKESDYDGRPRERASRSPKYKAIWALTERATSASREMLNTLVNILGPSKMLKYVPVRYWQFLVAANLHLLKTTLIAESATSESHSDVKLLRASIAAIRQGSPDDIHMAVRYARFLEIVFNSAHHWTSGGEATQTRDDLGPATAPVNGTQAPDAAATQDFIIPDFLEEFGNIGDSLDWSDETFGMLGIMGFLPNTPAI